MTDTDGRTLLGPFNRIMPKDGGTRRIISDHPFGPHRRNRLDAYAPERFEGRLPILMFIYGGGWDSGRRDEYAFVGRAFARAGFITAIADYRIVPEVRYPAFVEDCGRALSEALHVLPAFGGDPERVFLMGHSAGAYNAMMLALDAPRFGGPDLGAKLRGVVGLSGPYNFYPFDVSQAIAAFEGTPEPEASQPVNIVHDRVPDALLIHGRADTTCGLYNSENLAAKLRGAGVPVIERYYRGVKHILPLLTLFPLLRWRLPVYRDVLAFMRSRI